MKERAASAGLLFHLRHAAARLGLRQHARVTAAALVVVLAALTGLAWRWHGDPPPARVASVPADRLPPVEPTRYEPVPVAAARAHNAAVPLARSAGPAAAPFLLASRAGDLARAEDCLAAAAFYEAGDDADGQRAVAQVVLNRVHHPAFPKTVCGVVFQGSERRTGCQFTFTCDGAMTRHVPSVAVWARARAIAAAALGGAVYAPVGLATHYHADWVVPYWSARLDKIARVGSHLFYRWTGWWGTAGAFRGRERGGEPMVGLLAGLSNAHRDATSSVPGELVVARWPVRPVLSTASDPDLFLIRLSGSGAAYRARAEALCAARSPCTVMGWTDPQLIARSLPLTLEQMDGLAFRFERQAGGGPVSMRWNCAREPRRDAAECLQSGALPIRMGKRDTAPVIELPPQPVAG